MHKGKSGNRWSDTTLFGTENNDNNIKTTIKKKNNLLEKRHKAQ